MRYFAKVEPLLLVALLLAPIGEALASRFSIESESAGLQVGGSYIVDVFLDTEDEDVNAVEGTLVFPEGSFHIEDVRDGGSLVVFWVKRPQVLSGRIVFSGIVPGGHIGKKSHIFSFVIKPLRTTSASFEIQDAQVLLNDGKGTPARVKAIPLTLEVAERLTEPVAAVREYDDIDPPEEFAPVIGSDERVFDGKFFLVFATQDKGSGIDHYEVREGEGGFAAAESPHLLQNQGVNEDIFVKAVDKKGNERVSVLRLGKKGWRPYQKHVQLAMMALVGALAVLFFARAFSKRKRGL